MGKIKILDDRIANMIAAGEVVDHPAALLKELIENALDAQATRIRMDVKQGGKYLRVSDNGSGMDRADLLLSIERHATSKIETAEDIFNIHSFGFRGEALASVAAVSKLRIASRMKEDSVGNALLVSGGKITGIQTAVMNLGTEVEVSHLFYNTPARLKFLKSSAAEYSAIKEIVLKLALANAHCQFQLTMDGKGVITTTGTGVESAIVELFGVEVFKALTPFEFGYVGNISLTRHRRDSMYTFVNHRVVKSSLLEEAIIEGYDHYLMKGRFPFVILFLKRDPKSMDINVHPSKKIIRFLESQRVFWSVKEAISQGVKGFQTEIAAPIEVVEKKVLVEPTFSQAIFSNVESVEKPPSFSSYFHEVKDEEPISREQTKEKNTLSKLPENVVVLGQLNQMYIVVQEGKNLKIFDQHVVEERLIYDYYRQQASGKIASKQFLIGKRVSLLPLEMDLVKKHEEILTKMGFSLKVVSPREIELISIPDFYTRLSTEALFREVLSECEQEAIHDIREELFISMACRASIKAGMPLPKEKMESLIAAIYQLGEFTCPHGRPLVISISSDDLEKYFKRK